MSEPLSSLDPNTAYRVVHHFRYKELKIRIHHSLDQAYPPSSGMMGVQDKTNVTKSTLFS